MTVSELLELLDDQDPNAEVRLAFQPRWPLAHTVAGVASGDAVGSDGTVVWIGAGDHPADSIYAPTDIFDEF